MAVCERGEGNDPKRGVEDGLLPDLEKPQAIWNYRGLCMKNARMYFNLNVFYTNELASEKL